jgi:acyl-CoA synthetase (NDP forming)
MTQAQELGVALSYWAPTGNEADLEAADFAEYFVRDPETAAVCGYIEGFKSGERLRSAAIAAIENDTPIVLVKVGRSSLGSSMAQSHTGHLVGADEVYDAFFEQFGMIRVPDVDQLVEVGAALARCPIPTAEGVVICSASGGTAAHVADLATLGGLSLPPLSARTQADLADVIPAGFRLDNPVDNGGAVVIGDREAGRRIWELCLRDEHIGVMLCPIPASAPQLTDAMIEIVLQVAATATKPILPIWSGPSVRHPGYQALWDAGLPVFRNVSNAVAAARALIGHPARTPRLKEIARLAREHPSPAVPSGEGWLLEESESTRWLESQGIPFARHALAGTAEEAVEEAEAIGYPVVLKGRGATHKSERGFVVTGLADAAAVRAAAERLHDRGAAGFLVAEQVSGGIELLVGISTDPVLGPVVLVGAGGVTAEAQRDVARSVLPLTRERAAEMLAGLRISPLLDGWRGAPAADRDAVVDLLLKIASLAQTGQVAELDINPILARPDGVLGLDALVRLAHR